MKKKVSGHNRIISYVRRNYDNILMVIGFALTFFLFTNVTRLLFDFISISGDSDGYPYTATYQYLPERMEAEDIQEIVKALSDKKLNCKIEGSYFQIGELFDRTQVSVYLVADALPDEKREGWSQADNSVIIGNTIKAFVDTKDSEAYLAMEGMEYQVFECLQNYTIDDNRIYIYWSNLTPQYQNAIIDALNEKLTSYENFYLTFQSDTPFDAKLDGFVDIISDRVIRITEYDNSEFLVSFQTKFFTIASVMLTVFAVICSIVISGLWISRRKREYLIRRTFGYDTGHIVRIILKESGSLALLSLALSWLLEAVYMWINEIYMVNLSQAILGILFSFLGSIVIELIVMLYPMIQIVHTRPTQSAIDSII